MIPLNNTQADVKRLLSGDPIGNVRYYGNGLGMDDQGRVFTLKSAEQERAQQRYAAQKGRGRKHTFTFSGIERLPYVSDALTYAQSGYLLILASYLNYDGVIVRNENDPEAMSTADMQRALRLTGTKESTFYDFLDACLNYGIMRREGDAYSITRDFHFKGALDGELVVRTFITQLRAMYTEVSAHDIGILYRLLSCMHRDSNILCANPEERIPSKVRKLNRKQVAEKVGVSPGVISRAVSRMVFDGKSVFAKITTATDGTFYMLNPSVFRRKDTEFDETVKGVFGFDY